MRATNFEYNLEVFDQLTVETLCYQYHSLTVTCLLGTILRSGEPLLAYLSAWKTGGDLDEKLADNSGHITGIFQPARFRCVVETLRGGRCVIHRYGADEM